MASNYSFCDIPNKPHIYITIQASSLYRYALSNDDFKSMPSI